MKKVYRTKNQKQRTKDRLINNLVVIILIIAGIGITLSPMITYLAGPYASDEFHNTVQAGSVFTFVGTVGGYNSSGRSPFAYGILLNVSFLSNERAKMSITIFRLSGTQTGANIFLLPKNPFIASSITPIYFNSVQESLASSQLLSLLFINSTERDTVIGNIGFNNSSTFNMQPYPYLGYPQYEYVSINGTSLSNFYVPYSNMRVMGLLELNELSQQNSLMKLIYPNFNSSNLEINNMGICFGSSNTSPAQDWTGWLLYGFGIAFPVNLIMIGAGLVLYLLRFRR